MKISYQWLKDYIDIKKTPEQLAEDLSLFGHEVESIEKIGDDTVFDLEITPNRGDCLSVLGIARELAALYKLKVKSEKLKVKVREKAIDKSIHVKIQNTEICPRFTARIIDGIKIGESPKWMQEKLATYGFRPINNIVDITNYVMVATGQPLHAFDYDKIKNGLMSVRLSKKDEEVMTLDGKNRVLPVGAIIIEDEEKIYDLAGIMGGYKSEVDEGTKTIILQGSIFDPVLIRKASKFLNHVTDASYRYERGVDFEGTVVGVDMAAKLILEVCRGAKTGELIDNWTPACAKIFADEPVAQKSWQCKTIEVGVSEVNRLLGTNLPIEKMAQNLKLLNMDVEISGEKMLVTPPSYRFYDVKIWQDVAEEIARMVGYNKIGKSQISKLKSQNLNVEFAKREKIKDQLKDLSFTEIYSYSFIDKKQADILGIETKNLPEIEKPLSPEAQYLRPSLLSSLLTAIAKNPWSPEVNIFEIEKVFGPARHASQLAGVAGAEDTEKWQLGIATVGKNDQLISKAKEKLGIDGEIQSVDQKILDFYKIRRPVKVIIADINNLKSEVGEYSEEISESKYEKISSFPPTVRDIAFIVDTNLDPEQVKKDISEVSENILFVELFDEFESEKFGAGKKNLAFHIWLQDLKGPVKDDDASEIMKKIGEMVSNKYQAKVRS